MSETRMYHKFDDIILHTREEAKDVLDHLFDIVLKYGMANYADLHQLVGFSGNYIDVKWGWKNLHGAKITHIRDGYLLDLPNPVLLESEKINKSCPTCYGSSRETTMFVCQTCGMDYGQDPPTISVPWTVEKTGLKASTCIDLFNSGWHHIEEINKPSRWEKK